MKEGLGPGGSRAGAPTWSDVRRNPCPEGEWEQRLNAGGRLIAEFSWKARLVPGIPVPPGEIDVEVTVAYDRQNQPPGGQGVRLPAPAAGTDTALWPANYKELQVRGRISVVGEAKPILSGGQAVDRALTDSSLAAWLVAAPRNTWANANLFLEAGFQSSFGFTVGPHWAVELFVEPRRFAIVYVDPWSGEILREDYCEAPCWR
jgi:hypothetical protein